MIRMNVNSKPKEKRFLIDGYYGEANVGDEAILSSLLGQIKDNYEDAFVTVASEDPDHTINNHAVDAAVDRFQLLGNKLDWVQAVRLSDILIIGGGGLFSLNSFSTYSVKILIAKSLGREVHIIGMGGAEPATGFLQRHQLSLILACVDSVTVRDEITINKFRGANSEVPLNKCPDLVYSLDIADYIREKTDKNKTVVCVRKPKNRDFQYKTLAKALDELYADNECEIVFIPFNENCNPPDSETAKKIVNHMQSPATVIDRNIDWSEAVEYISNANLVIAMRLHSIILSARTRSNFVGISYESKCGAQFAELGITDGLRSDNLDDGNLKRQLLTRWNRDKLPPELNNQITQLEAESEENMRKLQAPETSTPKLLLCYLAMVAIVSIFIDAIKMASGSFHE